MITSKDIRAMNLAEKMLKCSSHPKYKFAAIIAKSNRVISVGINKVSAPKRFTKQREGMHLHAEIAAIYNIDKSKTYGATLYVNGMSTAGNKIKTRPCEICLSAIEEMGIRRVVYQDLEGIKEIK